MCFTVFLFEIVWIGTLHCYMKQEQNINDNKIETASSEPLTWDETSHFDEDHENNFIDSNEMKEEISENKKDHIKSISDSSHNF